jgi:hypothetical protein
MEKTMNTITSPVSAISTGTLIGKVTVEPATVAPGQSVLVQVLDPSDKLISDPEVTVIIQGAPTASRYLQFSAPGAHNLFVMATKGSVTETAMAPVTVTGTALEFRKSVAAKAATEIPILQVATVLGRPYTASFNLGITLGARRRAASALAKSAPKPPTRGGAVPTAPPKIEKSTGTVTQTISDTTDHGGEPASEATSYHWNFGDGRTLTTQTPNASHDYLPAIKAGDLVRTFDVSCTIGHDNITVKKTLLLYSSYGLCRRGGVVVPPVSGGSQYASFQHIAFSASLIVHNKESSPITLNAAAIVPFGDERTVIRPAPKFTTMKTPVVVAAESASALGLYVSLDQLQMSEAVVNGFTAHYSGEMKDGAGTPVPVRFSQVFRLRLSDSGIVYAGPADQLRPANWDHQAGLKAVAAIAASPKGAISRSGKQAIDSATNTIAIELSADPADINTLTRARSAIEAGLTSIALKNGALSEKGVALRLPRPTNAKPHDVPHIDEVTIDPLSPPPVAAGSQCYPDTISDADLAKAASEQLVCQLTDETETATMPASFQNALQGDIILSPAPSGTGDLIAQLFKMLTPPQTHSHSGIMTADQFEITHNTCSQSRVTDNLTTDEIDIPTGIVPSVLQYGWPGSITQSIDDANSNVYFEDPDSKKPYSVMSFDTDQQGETFALIYPLVVKPLPEHELAVRSTLRKVGDSAGAKGAQYEAGGTMEKPATLKKQQPGGCYYSFYAYTNPQLTLGFHNAAGADAPDWAKGLYPAVCSSFIWLVLKENNVPLVTKDQIETLADFSASARANGASVGPNTLDGLVFYPQAERAVAGQALYQSVMEQSLNSEDGFGTLADGWVNDAIAGPIVNQLLNAFASGNNDLQTAAWRTPGDGNAVSPDNTRLWNPPYYGYAEPLQFLPKHTETYTVSKWKKVTKWGSVKGAVRNAGARVANARVWVSDDKETYTKSDGTYQLDHVAIGKYDLKASVVTTTDGIQGERNNGNNGQRIELTADKSDLVQDIDLRGQLESFRRADIHYSLTGDHSGGFSGQKDGVEDQGQYTNSVFVDPGQQNGMYTYSYDYMGGGYYNVQMKWCVTLNSDNSLWLQFTAVMNSDNTGSDTVTATPYNIVVPVGKTVNASYSDLATYHFNDLFKDYTNGPVTLNFSVTNNQQTG